MKHSENTSENTLKADAFAQQIISNLTAALQWFNELQAQIQALQITQETSNVSFTSLITSSPLPVPVMTASPVYTSFDPQVIVIIAQIVTLTIQN